MAKLMEQLCRQHKLLSMATALPWNIAHVGGAKSYVLLGSLAKLERAIVRWTMDELTSKHHFTPVVVPNLIHDHVIERCGFPTKSARSQVYKISSNCDESILDCDKTKSESDDKSRVCIAGTSEFALASIHIGDTIPSEDLPKKYCALSRCYRAETSDTSSEWGLYRVHYFNKVEMFALTMPEDSPKMHQELLRIQSDLFKQLGLKFQVLDMPENDLGLSAKRKFDIEAWMAGRKRYGEISSTSNCEDYQTSRLNIKYSRMIEKDNQLQLNDGFVHSLNGTACSTIRLLIALVEQYQTSDDKIVVPQPLRRYMDNIESIPSTEDQLLADIELYPEEV